jgi:hypothetical protein
MLMQGAAMDAAAPRPVVEGAAARGGIHAPGSNVAPGATATGGDEAMARAQDDEAMSGAHTGYMLDASSLLPVYRNDLTGQTSIGRLPDVCVAGFACVCARWTVHHSMIASCPGITQRL